MTYLNAALLGLVQGITEFLPVSSSGHLTLLQNIFHMEGADLMFDVLLHLGTLLPILLVYKRDIRALSRGALGLIGMGKDRRRNTPKARYRRRMAILLLAGLLPLPLSLLLRGTAEQFSESTVLVGVLLLLNGGILFLAGHLSRSEKQEKDVNLLDSLLIGLSQVVAVLPGISRSGATISVGMLRGLPRSFAVKFSFLLSIPSIIGAAILSLVEAASLGFDGKMLPMYLVGMLAAAVSGYLGIRLLRWAASRSSFGGFAYYCWGAGIVALMLSLIA